VVLYVWDKYGKLQPVFIFPSIILKEEEKPKKRKRKHLHLVAWQRLQGGTE
jgi:hypothetical protein